MSVCVSISFFQYKYLNSVYVVLLVNHVYILWTILLKVVMVISQTFLLVSLDVKTAVSYHQCAYSIVLAQWTTWVVCKEVCSLRTNNSWNLTRLVCTNCLPWHMYVTLTFIVQAGVRNLQKGTFHEGKVTLIPYLVKLALISDSAILNRI